MALLQISEPDVKSTIPNIKPALGIDLGTTNSVIAIVDYDRAITLKDQINNDLIPSVVYYGKTQTLVGAQALAMRFNDYHNTIISIKRLIGQNLTTALKLNSNIINNYQLTDNNGILEITTAQGLKNPILISAEILKHLKQMAEQATNQIIDHAVITVPAYFNETQRQATKQAGELAGFKVLRLLSEPTAAAIAYGLEYKTKGIFLIYDLGGGTLDVSILNLNNGVFEVLAVSGDSNLGGDDFDQCLLNYFLQLKNLVDLTAHDLMILLTHAKKIKEEFGTKNEINFNCILSEQRTINITMNIDELGLLLAPLITKAILPLKKALRDAKLNLNQIDEIILVGGSTRLRSIRTALRDFFAKDLLTNLDPDRVIALGAAIQANILIGNKSHEDYLLLDVTPLSLGIETLGGLMEKIIPRNSTIPLAVAYDFTTYQDNQNSMSIHVLQGEQELVKDCRSLAKFSLTDIPPMAAGAAKIRINFQIDADGLLSVSAQELSSGVINSISVKPSFGLSTEQISEMIQKF